MSVRKIAGRTGEKIGARIDSLIDGKIAVKIIAPMLVASSEDSIERITWLASTAVTGARTPG